MSDEPLEVSQFDADNSLIENQDLLRNSSSGVRLHREKPDSTDNFLQNYQQTVLDILLKQSQEELVGHEVDVSL